MTEEEKMLYRLAGYTFNVKGIGEVICVVPGKDITQEIDTTKLIKEQEYLWGFILKLKSKLDNKEFVDKAPEEVVSREIKKWNDSWERFDMIDKSLKYLEEKKWI